MALIGLTPEVWKPCFFTIAFAYLLAFVIVEFLPAHFGIIGSVLI